MQLGSKGIRFVALVRGEATEVLDVPSGQFRPDFCVVGSYRRTMHVDDCLAGGVDEERYLERLHRSINSA